jgi:hypothetical protein
VSTIMAALESSIPALRRYAATDTRQTILGMIVQCVPWSGCSQGAITMISRTWLFAAIRNLFMSQQDEEPVSTSCIGTNSG